MSGAGDAAIQLAAHIKKKKWRTGRTGREEAVTNYACARRSSAGFAASPRARLEIMTFSRLSDRWFLQERCCSPSSVLLLLSCRYLLLICSADKLLPRLLPHQHQPYLHPTHRHPALSNHHLSFFTPSISTSQHGASFICSCTFREAEEIIAARWRQE